MSKHLEHELKRLEQQLMALAAVVEEHVQSALKAFETRDPELAQRIITGDSEIDHMEVDLEEECLKLLALYQPVAIDLRFIVAALKINNDLERVGDLATNIAKRVPILVDLPEIEIPGTFHEMAEEALALLRLSLDAFVKLDTKIAHKVRLQDAVVDKLSQQAIKFATEAMKKAHDTEEAYLQIIWVARNVERVGDHATNIAEDIIYMLDGDIVRHGPKPGRQAEPKLD